jgi:hypothetical protein
MMDIDIRISLVGPSLRSEREAVELIRENCINDVFEGVVDTTLEMHDNETVITDIKVVRVGPGHEEEDDA